MNQERPIATDSLRSQTLRALSWSFVGVVGMRGMQFVIGVVLARLLLPEQFGLIGMLTIFVAVGQAFLDSGFGAALIQKRDATHTDTCSIFYFNIVVGLLMAGLLCLAAPWIAGFYNQPVLTPLTRVLSLIIVVNSFSLIQHTLLVKRIDFKTQTTVSLIANLLSGLVGISLAVCGCGVWSLAVQQVLSALLKTILLWLLSAWRPALLFSLGSLREMFRFGSRMFLSGLLNTFFENIYLLVVGKLFAAASLGFYARAKTLEELPTQTLSGMVGRVTFPVFSAIQNEPIRLKKGLQRALTTLVCVNFPMMLGLALVAKPLVLLLLTEKWAPCIPYLRLLCVYGLLYPLHVINLNVLMAMGRSDLFFRLEVIKKMLVIINIAITWRWGIEAMIYGQIVLSSLAYYLNSYYNGVLLGYPIKEQLWDISPYLMAVIPMSVVVYAVGHVLLAGMGSRLLIQTCSGFVTYILACRLLRLPAFLELWQLGWERVRILRLRTA